MDVQTHSPQEAIRPADSKQQRNTFLIKILLLGLVTLGLLIPLVMANSLISERKQNSEDAISEVARAWGGDQFLVGPMLQIPYLQGIRSEGSSTVEYRTNYIYLMPQQLDVKGDVQAETKKRSIYTIPIYNSTIQLSGHFDLRMLQEAPGLPANLELDKASIVMGISETKGIKEQISISLNNELHKLQINAEGVKINLGAEYYGDADFVEPSYDTGRALLSAPYSLAKLDEAKPISFTATLSLGGSRSLSLAPIGSESKFTLNSNWPSPSFQGNFLPDSSSIAQTGFSAGWSIVDYNRSYSSVVKHEDSNVFGQNVARVHFFQERDHYTQSDRSTKYGILIVLLTFVSIFFIEMAMRAHNVSINVFHYLLVGLALVLFYSLLISISELVGFGWAYLISSVMTIGLVGFFFRSLLPPGKHALILVGIMSFLYLLVYLLIQMTTYALLAGSLGLFVILTIVMYVSSRLIK